jgi:tetratricopeptide (TPR) repeat protein
VRLLALLLLAAAARAEPVVRWIDATGKIRADELAEIIEESASKVEVRFADGTKRAIPGVSLIDVVREDQRDPGQRALLALRTHTSGKGAAVEKKELERIRAEAKEAWMKEYAAAALALSSEKSGKTDALDAFLQRYPSSRLGPEIQRARTRIQARAIPELIKAVDKYYETYLRLLQSNASYFQVTGVMRDLAVHVLERDVAGMSFVRKGMAERLSEDAPKNAKTGEIDLVWDTCARSTERWISLATAVNERAHLIRNGEKLIATLRKIRKLKRNTIYLLPGLHSDVCRELGETLLAGGQPDEAEREFRAAAEAAPDRARRHAAEQGLARARARNK